MFWPEAKDSRTETIEALERLSAAQAETINAHKETILNLRTMCDWMACRWMGYPMFGVLPEGVVRQERLDYEKEQQKAAQVFDEARLRSATRQRRQRLEDLAQDTEPLPRFEDWGAQQSAAPVLGLNDPPAPEQGDLNSEQPTQ